MMEQFKRFTRMTPKQVGVMNARMTIADDELTNPTGLEIGADGDIYISNKGFFAGVGEVLRLSLEKDTTCGCAPLRDRVN